jgi:hypothetical protein
MARVAATADEVTWTSFRQPYRSDRDYSAFGPFTFRRHDYEAAITAIAPAWVCPT